MRTAPAIPIETPALPARRPGHVLRIFTTLALGGLAIAAVVGAYLAFASVNTPVLGFIDDEHRLLDSNPEPAWWQMFFAGRWYLFHVPAAVFSALGFGFGWVACGFQHRRKVGR